MIFFAFNASAQQWVSYTRKSDFNGWLFWHNSIGIGSGWDTTMVPQATLHLHNFNAPSSSLLLTNQSTGFPTSSAKKGMLISTIGNKAIISSYEQDNLVLGHDTAQQMVISAGGFIGIGTAYPANLLHLHSPLNQTPTPPGGTTTRNPSTLTSHGILITNPASGNESTDGLLIGLASSASAKIMLQEPKSLSIGSNNVDAITIDPNGQVGIGTPIPAAKLHVNGNVRLQNLPSISSYHQERVLVVDAPGNVKTASPSLLHDNLGNHKATQNLNLSNHWLSPDGQNKGIQLKPNGNLQINTGIGQVNAGRCYTDAPYYTTTYIGFNAQSLGNGSWLFSTNGADNGGAAIIADVAGNLRFITYRPQQRNSNQIISDQQLLDNTRLFINHQGQVGIGICLDQNNNPKNYKLAVNGTIGAREIFVETNETPWPDYVFSSNYSLLSIPELEAFIKQHGHLPDIPSADEVQEKSIPLGEMNILLLKKIEELTLYIIELHKKIEKYEKSN